MELDSDKVLLQKTEDFIENKVLKLKSKNPNFNKWSAAGECLNPSFISGYGVDESILSQNFGLFPHEIVNSAQCLQYATAQYFLAEKLNLKPRFFSAHGLRQAKGSLNFEDKSIVDHAFIDVETEPGKRQILDSLLSTVGPVKFDPEKKLIILSKKSGSINTRKTYDDLIEFKKEDILNLLIKSRTPKGGVLAISQYLRTLKKFKLGKSQIPYTFKFLPNENILRSYINYNLPLIANNYSHQDLEFDSQTGKIKDSRLSVGSYSKVDFDIYENQTELFSESQTIIDPFFELLKRIFSKRYNGSSSHNKNNYTKNLQYLASVGLNSFNTVQIEKEYSGITIGLNSSISTLEQRIENQFSDKYSNEILQRSLLIHTLYHHQKKEEDSKYLFSLTKRDIPLLEMITEFEASQLELLKYSIDCLSCDEAGMRLKKNINQSTLKSKKEKSIEILNKYRDFANLRKYPSLRILYDQITDIYQFGMSKSNLSILELETEVNLKGFSVEDEYKRQVFNKLQVPFQAKRLLRKNQFITNLTSMISKSYW